MAFRRRRRAFSRRGATPLRKRIWVPFYAEAPSALVTVNGDWLAAFPIVRPHDYTDSFDPAVSNRQEGCTVVRSVGRIFVDFLTDQPGTNGITWAAMMIPFSEEAMENTFTADFADLFIHLAPTMEQNLSRFRVVQHWPVRIVQGSYIAIGGSAAFQASVSPNGEQLYADFDVRQKVKLRTDQSLWIVVTGNAAVDQDPDDTVFPEVTARTLILDD